MKTWEKDIEEMTSVIRDGSKKYYKFEELSQEAKTYALEGIELSKKQADEAKGSAKDNLQTAIHGVFSKSGALIISYWEK